jgi:hypothetical protein
MAPPYRRRRIPTRARWLCGGIALLIFVARAQADQLPDPSSPGEEDSAANSNSNKDSPKRVISLVESLEISRRNFVDPGVEEVRRQYWKRTFNEIRNLATGMPRNTQPKASGSSGSSSSSGSVGSSGVKFLSQWKLLLDDPVSQIASGNDTDVLFNTTSPAMGQLNNRPMRRFEGFLSWDRLLQDWSEDVQEYLDKAQAENEGEYSMSNFGRSTSQGDEIKTLPGEAVEVQHAKGETQHRAPENTTSAKQNTALPIPAPAKPGEAVLPHTDISDKSKRILIVTTAAMPWRTGTAVNPLLRAAYLTKGRKDAGGSITLMLPWLKRKSDQERVYGADNTFETQEDQEDYIRTWLRDDAGFVEASQELNIQWYTGWQNKVQNSIYSMGDITADVSADDFDICILEEPEHLNW